MNVPHVMVYEPTPYEQNEIKISSKKYQSHLAESKCQFVHLPLLPFQQKGDISPKRTHRAHKRCFKRG